MRWFDQTKNFCIKKKWWFVSIALLILLLFVLYYTLGLQIQFLLGEELRISFSPTEHSFSVVGNESVSVSSSLAVRAKRSCSFICEHEVLDVGSGQVIYSWSTDQPFEAINYSLAPVRQGEGQDKFSHEIVCRAQRTSLCRVSEKPYFASSLITLNRNMSSQMALEKQSLESQVPQFLSDIASTKENYALLSSYIDLFPHETLAFSNEFSSLVAAERDLLVAWNDWDFSSVFIVLDDPQYTTSMSSISSALLSVQNLTSELEDFREVLMNISSQLPRYRELFQEFSSLQNFSFWEVQINDTIDDFKSISSLADARAVLDLRPRFDAFIAERESVFQAKDQELQRLDQEVRFFYDALVLNRSFSSFTCDVVASEQEFLASRDVGAARQLFSPDISHTTYEQFSTLYLNQLDLQRVNSSHTVNISSFNAVPTASGSINFSSFSRQELGELVSFNFSSPCVFQRVEPVNLSSFIVTDSFVFTPSSFDTPAPVCCAFGDCSACCTEETCQEHRPILFIHGRALSQNNAPEESHSAFGVIQQRLDGVINAGQLGRGRTSSLPDGEWGRVPAPIGIRLSYYLISFIEVGDYVFVTQKTDNLETYAIRLHELIEEVKRRTGRDQVDIVAHSMGGLVTRQYLALFGEDSVHTAVLVGTPNYGIEGRVRRFCRIAGSPRECEDLYADSVFLRRLNEREFHQVNLHTIRAVGCDMAGEDGDGVVLARSVPLPEAINHEIFGECTDVLGTDLHINMLHPDLYPETFSIIRSALGR